MLTVGSNVFFCPKEVAREVAEDYANLRLEVDGGYLGRDYFMWQDRATGGGGGRVVWMDGICWVSRHSGYAYADITQELCEFLVDLGATPIRGADMFCVQNSNPNILGSSREARKRLADTIGHIYDPG